MTTNDGQERDAWIRRATLNLSDAWEYVAQAQDGRCDRWPGAGVSDLGSACPFLNNATLDHPLDDADAAEFVGRLDGFYSGQAGGSSLLWTVIRPRIFPDSARTSGASRRWGSPARWCGTIGTVQAPHCRGA